MEGTSVTRSPWKPGPPREKPRQTERKDSSDRVPGGARGESVVGARSPSEGTPDDDGSFQTVWATVFENHVEKHTVAAPLGRSPWATTPGDLADVSEPRSRLLGPRSSFPQTTALKREWLEDPDLERGGGTAFSSGEPRQHRAFSLLGRHPGGEKGSHHPFLKLPESAPAPERVEPRYDVVHAVGERAHSEAVPTAPEEKALTLRSGRSRPPPSQEVTHAVTPTDPKCRPEGQVGSVQRASLIWEARGTREVSGPKPEFHREPKDTHGGSCPSPRWTGSVAVSWHKAAVGLSEGRSSEPSPEAASARTTLEAQHPGTEGAGIQPGERAPSRGAPPEPHPRAKDEADDSRVQLQADMPGQTGPLAMAGSQEPEARRRRASPGDQRLDRWRRRTLPHDVKFDEFSLLPPEHSFRAEPRRDHLSPTAPGALGKPQLLLPGREGTRQGSPGTSLDRVLPISKQGSPGEPKATFFAVTYQIPDTQKAKSVVRPGPENWTEASRKAAPPLSPLSYTPTSVPLNHEELLETMGGKNRAPGREREHTSFPKPTEHPASLGDRILGPPGERISDADAVWVRRGPEGGGGFQNGWKDSGNKMSPGGAPQTPPAFRSPPKASELLVRRTTEAVSEMFPGKAKAGYRSSVLDIDALMAEYQRPPAGSPREAQEWMPGSPAELRGSDPERPGLQGEADQRRRSLKERPEAEAPQRQASFAETSPVSTPGSGKYLAETPGAATHKVSSPLWGPPHWAPPEKNTGASSGPAAGPRKKGPGIPEDEKKTFVSKHHSAKCQHPPAESKPATAWADPGSGASVQPRLSPTDQRKGTPRKPPGRGEESSVAPWADHLRDLGRSPLDVKRAYSEKGPPLKIREGLSIMQEARERRQEQPKGRPSLPRESAEARDTKTGLCRQESGNRDSQKVSTKAVAVFSNAGETRRPEASNQDLRGPGGPGDEWSQAGREALGSGRACGKWSTQAVSEGGNLCTVPAGSQQVGRGVLRWQI